MNIWPFSLILFGPNTEFYFTEYIGWMFFLYLAEYLEFLDYTYLTDIMTPVWSLEQGAGIFINRIMKIFAYIKGLGYSIKKFEKGCSKQGCSGGQNWIK